MVPSPSYPDLSPYPSAADEMLGMQPLAVGWLSRKKKFQTAAPDPRFVARLAAFCRPENYVFLFRPPLRCALENHAVEEGLGRGEIRVIGDEEIFAAPDLILHYVTAHHYAPPPEFVAAVLDGPDPAAAEYRALVKALKH